MIFMEILLPDDSEDIIAAINYATSSYDTPNPIKILNFSYGGYNLCQK